MVNLLFFLISLDCVSAFQNDFCAYKNAIQILLLNQKRLCVFDVFAPEITATIGYCKFPQQVQILGCPESIILFIFQLNLFLLICFNLIRKPSCYLIQFQLYYLILNQMKYFDLTNLKFCLKIPIKLSFNYYFLNNWLTLYHLLQQQ